MWLASWVWRPNEEIDTRVEGSEWATPRRHEVSPHPLPKRMIITIILPELILPIQHLKDERI